MMKTAKETLRELRGLSDRGNAFARGALDAANRYQRHLNGDVVLRTQAEREWDNYCRIDDPAKIGDVVEELAAEDAVFARLERSSR